MVGTQLSCLLKRPVVGAACLQMSQPRNCKFERLVIRVRLDCCRTQRPFTLDCNLGNGP